MSMKHLLALITLVLVIFPVASAFGQPGTREFVGFSIGTAKGDAGILQLHNLCEFSYKGSKMCNSADIMGNGASQSAVIEAKRGWMSPTFILQGTYNNVGQTLQTADISSVLLFGADLGDYNCKGWTHQMNGDFSLSGIVFDATKTPPQVFPASCHRDLPVACCCPVGENCPAFSPFHGFSGPGPLPENP